MSRKSISYTKGYEHSDFADLLSELRGESENTAMVDGALALAIPSPIVPVPNTFRMKIYFGLKTTFRN